MYYIQHTDTTYLIRDNKWTGKRKRKWIGSFYLVQNNDKTRHSGVHVHQYNTTTDWHVNVYAIAICDCRLIDHILMCFTHNMEMYITICILLLYLTAIYSTQSTIVYKARTIVLHVIRANKCHVSCIIMIICCCWPDIMIIMIMQYQKKIKENKRRIKKKKKTSTRGQTRRCTESSIICVSVAGLRERL